MAGRENWSKEELSSKSGGKAEGKAGGAKAALRRKGRGPRRSNRRNFNPDQRSLSVGDLKKGASALGSIGKSVLSKLFGRSEDGIEKAVNRFANSEHAGFERGEEMSGKDVNKLIAELKKDGEDESSDSPSKGGATAPPVASPAEPAESAKSTMTPKERKKAEQDYKDFLDSQEPEFDADEWKRVFDRDDSVKGVRPNGAYQFGEEEPHTPGQWPGSEGAGSKPAGPNNAYQFGKEGSPTGKLPPGAGVRKAGPPRANRRPQADPEQAQGPTEQDRFVSGAIRGGTPGAPNTAPLDMGTSKMEDTRSALFGGNVPMDPGYRESFLAQLPEEQRQRFLSLAPQAQKEHLSEMWKKEVSGTAGSADAPWDWLRSGAATAGKGAAAVAGMAGGALLGKKASNKFLRQGPHVGRLPPELSISQLAKQQAATH